MRGKPKSLRHQPRVTAYADGKGQRLQMKPESNLCRAENHSCLWPLGGTAGLRFLGDRAARQFIW